MDGRCFGSRASVFFYDVTTVTTFSDHIYKIMKIENGNKKMIVRLKKAVTVVTKVTVESPGGAYDNCNNYYNYFFTPIYNFMKTENGKIK